MQVAGESTFGKNFQPCGSLGEVAELPNISVVHKPTVKDQAHKGLRQWRRWQLFTASRDVGDRENLTGNN